MLPASLPEPALNSVSTSFVPPAGWGRGLGLVLPSPSQPASLGESVWDGEILVEQRGVPGTQRAPLELHFLSEEPPSGLPWQERQGSRAGGWV